MASKGRLKAGRWEFVVKRAGVLEKPLYLYFATQEEGIEYCRNLEALLVGIAVKLKLTGGGS